MIRFASLSDAEAILAIYAQYIDTSITFEYELPTLQAFRGRIRDISAVYPYLVREENGTILGYAYAHRYRERAAYQWGAELSVYVDRNAHGRGIGAGLYTAVMELLTLQGVRTVYGIVTQPNEKSDRLHAAMGFTPAGIVRRAGFKNGKWHDVITYEKAIGTFHGAPQPLIAIRDVDPNAAARILAPPGAKDPI